MEALVSEWHDALRFYDHDRIQTAWRTWRNTQKFLPSISEILAILKEQAPRVGPSPKPVELEPKEPFCKDGRNEAEEHAHRVARCLEMRRQFKFGVTYHPDEPDTRSDFQKRLDDPDRKSVV